MPRWEKWVTRAVLYTPLALFADAYIKRRHGHRRHLKFEPVSYATLAGFNFELWPRSTARHSILADRKFSMALYKYYKTALMHYDMSLKGEVYDACFGDEDNWDLAEEPDNSYDRPSMPEEPADVLL